MEKGMLKYLLILADYLDQKSKVREANVVDVFITKVAQEETWNDESNKTPQLTPEYRMEQAQNLNKVPLNDEVSLDLNQHPLGFRAVGLVKAIFNNADSEQIPVQDLQEQIKGLAALALSYDENLQFYREPEENPNPINPAQFKEILNASFRLVNKDYQSGEPDLDFVRDSVDTAYKYYEDRYLEDYMRLPSSDRDYLNPEIDTMQPVSYVPEKQLTPQEYQKLVNRQEDELEGLRQSLKMDRLEKDLHPDLAKRRREQMQDKMKKDYPEEWHSILFQ